MFNKILIANRGEIACRIIKTARRLGIESVAIYSSADRDSLHVTLADSAFYLGEAEACASYLNINAIVNIASLSGAQAIHPGYGFLSENPAFAQACVDANIVFIGPSVHALTVMGSKQLAKQTLENTAVPLTPGYHGADQSDARLLDECKKLGFPVLLKAALGGGGKGMRRINHETEFAQALSGAKRESLSYFADETMLIEKLMLQARHIEIQIMADHHGQIVHLFERDCSIQRRHQKIIEEAPASNLSPRLRNDLTDAAITIARAIDYVGAGTVEFLVTPNEQFYFMEMNTRLQVEHPVTEMITGLDLVEWQIRIAAKEPLPCKQEQIKNKGYAIECRIYAEDPYQDCLPSIGECRIVQEPIGEELRIDTGIRSKGWISKYYDPTISKLITWGINRDVARLRMRQALKDYLIAGVKTNIPFLQAVIDHESFINSSYCTDFLDEGSVKLQVPDLSIAIDMAACIHYLNTWPDDHGIAAKTVGWQMHLTASWNARFVISSTEFCVQITPINDHQLMVRQDDQTNTWLVYLGLIDNSIFSSLRPAACPRDPEILLNAQHYCSETQRFGSRGQAAGRRDLNCQRTLNNKTLIIDNGIQQYQAVIEQMDGKIILFMPTGAVTVETFNHQHDLNHNLNSGQLTAPMPATVVAILKAKGDRIKAGDGLMVLEAMKMEHTIYAPGDGLLLDIFYDVGTQISEGVQLISMEMDS